MSTATSEGFLWSAKLISRLTEVTCSRTCRITASSPKPASATKNNVGFGRGQEIILHHLASEDCTCTPLRRSSWAASLWWEMHTEARRDMPSAMALGAISSGRATFPGCLPEPGKAVASGDAWVSGTTARGVAGWQQDAGLASRCCRGAWPAEQPQLTADNAVKNPVLQQRSLGRGPEYCKLMPSREVCSHMGVFS